MKAARGLDTLRKALESTASAGGRAAHGRGRAAERRRCGGGEHGVSARGPWHACLGRQRLRRCLSFDHTTGQ